MRRAQEAKGLSLSMPSPKASPQSPEAKSNSTLSPASMLMRPPLCEIPTDLSVSSSEMGHMGAGASNEPLEPANPNMLQIPNKRAAASTANRMKKLRFNKHASVAGMNETKVDDIATDIIIPRERVVSICNMDKDALDDYLNEGGDSQEQEAELLQYFQTTANQEKHTSNVTTFTMASSNNTTTTSCATSGTITIPTTHAYPLLENYQLHQNAGANSGEIMVVDNTQTTMTPPNQIPRKQDQINELRQYLQQNLHHPASVIKHAEERTVTSSSQIGSDGHGGWKANESTIHHHTASNSLAALSLPYQQASQDQHNEDTSMSSIGIQQLGKKLPPTHVMRSVRPSSAIIQNQSAQQSPNSRSKNFNFVPISPGPQSPRVISQHTAQLPSNIHAVHGRNTFLSPRRSPAVRKLVNKDLVSLKSLQDPSVSTFDSAYKNEVSASAPSSPSITPHHFQFNAALMAQYNNNATSISAATSSNQLQQPHQHQASTCSMSGMCPVLERSQSVPLHCQSPAFNAPVSSTAYNSVCNSMAQTPVPSEFTDFTNDNFLDMLAESSDQQIKVECNEMSNLMQSDCIRNHVSRSVPSTPLPRFQLNPLHGFVNAQNTPGGLQMINLGKHSIDNSKSVPTTPNALIGSSGTPFRYSPDHHRDYLINGNTVDATVYSTQTNSSNASQRNLSQHSSVSSTQANSQVLLTTSTQPIEDLPNYSDVNDPIIEGSHLMNNL